MFARRALPCSVLLVALALLAAGPASADGPKDNLPDNVRPIPPKGIDLPAADLAEVSQGLQDLRNDLRAIGKHDLLPDVEIYEKAVRYAVDHKEVFDAKGVPAVKKVLKDGLERAKLLKDKKSPWTTQTGYVVRGYRSRIDGSAQPYGLLVPAGYDFKGEDKHRLDFWWHGRGETLSEANFIANQQNASGIIPAQGAFVLFPYGRYCNANKFAGEIDSFEALDHAQKHYRIDDDRVVARGFSMGGAACWQYAVHYPTMWAANAPGAGFSETPEFLNVFQAEKVEPTWYEKKLWHLYNATDYAANLFNVPTVAYSGEIDRQKQAADVMEREMNKEGLKLLHLIGPKTGHSYEKGAKEELNKRIDAIVEKSRDPQPNKVRFTTFTLRYNKCFWLTIDGVGKHWERARADGEFADGFVTLKTENVTALSINFKFDPPALVKGVKIDGQTPWFIGGNPMDGLVGHFRKVNGKWQVVGPVAADARVKRHGLQGPIDDAFMDSFVMVKPTGKPMHAKTGEWADQEMKHAVAHWRQQFRGDAPVKDDTAITDTDIANSNLILWGDPSSNAVLAKLADKLPVKWTKGGVMLGDKVYDPTTHVPVLIYPNPLNPKRYVVLNSGFTFREYDYLNNARQVPKLPDYAVIDVTTPPNSRYPGTVVRAGFFGEQWELRADDGK